MAVCSRSIFPRVSPIRPGANDDDRRVRGRRLSAGGLYKFLAVVTRTQLAQAELGCSEMVDAGWYRSASFQISAHDIQLNFIQRAGAGRRAKKGFPQIVFPAARYAGREEENLR